MATLVFTAIGTVIGGPLGGKIGMMLGKAVDQNLLFKPKGREGPRLDNLEVQTSSYGTPIPRIYGTMRVAGTVIWATDLIETKKKSGGKGQPSVTTYSYAANFAVALSSRPILAVKRIWADGKLLRGTAGDIKVAGKLRVHTGAEGQGPDPLIASSEGAEGTPAYRGMAYAVFEGLALADFGNRIPMLTFEVEADSTTSLPTIIADVGGGLILHGPDHPLVGYAVGGESKRTALDLMATPFGGWEYVMPGGARAAVSITDLGAHAEEEGERRHRFSRRDQQSPHSAEIGYFDPARDYQAGRQSATTGTGTGATIEMGLPATMAAGDAKALAALTLQRGEQGSAHLTLSLMPRWMALAPGDELTVAGQSGLWRVREAMVEKGAVRVTLIPAPTAPTTGIEAADPGRNLPSADLLIGETSLHLLDLGYAMGAGEARYMAAAGGGAGWRRAPLLLTDGNGGAEPIGAAPDNAIIGMLETAPGSASAMLFDRTNSFVVQLINPQAMLEDASDDRLLSGMNAAMVGDEILQFGSATPMGNGRWRLSTLLRGRRGTEGGIGAQPVGSRFVLLDREALLPITNISPGQNIGLIATGLGDGDGIAAPETLIVQAGQRPLPPVHLSAQRQTDGSLRLSWVRQSRSGWSWIDGADAPIGEEREAYRLTLGQATPQIIETSQSDWTIAAGDPLLSCANLHWSVSQMGDFGPSDPANAVSPYI